MAANLFQWLGTSGVAVQGKTGAAMMDGRDGEALMAAYGQYHPQQQLCLSAVVAVQQL